MKTKQIALALVLTGLLSGIAAQDKRECAIVNGFDSLEACRNAGRLIYDEPKDRADLEYYLRLCNLCYSATDTNKRPDQMKAIKREEMMQWQYAR